MTAQGSAGHRFRAAISNIQTTIEHMVEEENKVVVRGTVMDTHQGEVKDVLLADKRVRCNGINITRMTGACSQSTSRRWTPRGLLQQPGVISVPGQAEG